MPLQGEKCSELFRMFFEIHTRVGAKDDKSRYLPRFFSVGYLNTILVPDKKNNLNDHLDLG